MFSIVDTRTGKVDAGGDLFEHYFLAETWIEEYIPESEQDFFIIVEE